MEQKQEPRIETADQEFVVKFKKAYKFEGKIVSEVDLSGLADLTGQDMINAEKYLSSMGTISATPELTLGYCFFIASVSSDKPIEFFKTLTPNDAIKVKNRVTSFFYSEG